MADPFPLAGPSITPADVLTALGLATAMQLPQQPKPVPPAAGNSSLLNEILGRNGSPDRTPPTFNEVGHPLAGQSIASPFTLPSPPPSFPPGAQGIAPTPIPPTVEGSPVIQPAVPPGILAALGMYPPELSTSSPAPGMQAGQVVAPPTPGASGIAPAVEPLGPVFPGDSLLQNLGIPLPTTQSPQQGRGSGGAAPRSPTSPGAPPSLPPGAQPVGPTGPVTAPEPAGPTGDRRGQGPTDGGRGASRLLDTLAVIGTVLSQPPPPGGNLVSQIGRAMGMGFMYNKMLDSAEVEQINTSKKRELESRRTAVAEKHAGIAGRRVDQQGRLVDIEEQKAPAEIELLRARATAAGLDAKFKDIELRFKNDPVRRDLEMRKLQAEVDNIGARTDLTRNQTESRDVQDQARIAKALKDAGALDPMNPAGINWRVAAPIYNTFGYTPLGPSEVAAAKAKFQELVKSGLQPVEAERQINLWLTRPDPKGGRRAPISLVP